MKTDWQDPIGDREDPAVSINGRIQFVASDSWSAVAGVVMAIVAGLAAIGFALSSYGRIPDGVHTSIVLTAVLTAVLFIIGLIGWRNGKDELTVFSDRTVLRPSGHRGSGPALVIQHEELQHLAIEKSWIRLRQKNGRRLSFKAPRLQVEDVFDVLSDKVEAVNPMCVVKSR